MLLLINVTKPFVLAITVTSEEYIDSSCFVLNLRHVMPNTVVCVSSPARGFSDVFVSQGSGFRKGGRRKEEGGRRERGREREREREKEKEKETEKEERNEKEKERERERGAGREGG